MIILSDLLTEYSGSIIIDGKLCRKNIYAGAVVSKNGPYIIPERKILLTKRYELLNDYKLEYFEDLLYDTPNYRASNNLDDIKTNEFCIDCVIGLDSLLKEFGFDEHLTHSDIRKIYNMCLHPNSELFTKEHKTLPINWIDYLLLDRIAQYKKQPSNYEKNEYPNRFKTKVKTYTFK